MAVFRNMTPMMCYRLPQDVITFGVGRDVFATSYR